MRNNSRSFFQERWNDHVSVYQGYLLIRQLAVLLGAILLTKGGLSIGEISHFEKLMYIGQILTVFWVNSLIQSFLAVYPKIEAEEQNTFTSFVFGLFTVITFFICSVFFLFKPILLPFLTNEVELPGLWLLLTYLLFNTPSLLIPTLFFVRKETKDLRFFTIFYLIGYVLVFAFFVLSKSDLLKLLLSLNIFALCLYLIAGQKSWVSLRFRLKPKYIERLSVVGLPLLLYALLVNVPPIFDSWLVQKFFSRETFAIYRYGAKEIPFISTLAISLGTSMVPILATNIHNGMESLKIRARRLFFPIFIITLVCLIFTEQLLVLLYNENFISSAPVFKIYLLIVFSRLIYPQSILMSLGKTKPLLFVAIVEVICNMTLSFTLGFYFGLVGIAIGTLLANYIEKIITVLYVKWYYKISPNKYTDLRRLFIYNIIIFIAYYITL